MTCEKCNSQVDADCYCPCEPKKESNKLRVNTDEKGIVSIEDWYKIDGKWYHLFYNVRDERKYVDGKLMV